MREDEKAMLAALKKTPLDEGLRLAYADWLDENDRPDEGQRQREWIKAFNYILQFTRTDEESWEYDDEGEKIPDSHTINYKGVMDEVEWWRSTVTGEYTQYGLGGSIGFGTTYAQDALQDAATRREFWRCFKVLTGVEAPEDLRNQEWYHCAC